MTASPRATCRTCVFAAPARADQPDTDVDGYCHRLPPTPFITPVGNSGEMRQSSAFPVVHLDASWCGEYRRRSQPRKRLR